MARVNLENYNNKDLELMIGLLNNTIGKRGIDSKQVRQDIKDIEKEINRRKAAK